MHFSGRLFVFEALPPAQDPGFLLLGREMINGLVYQDQEQLALMGIPFFRLQAFLAPFPFTVPFPHHFPDGVEGMVPANDEKERPEAFDMRQGFPGKPELHENVLDDLFRQGPVFQMLINEFEYET
jgi:hypothetical protein